MMRVDLGQEHRSEASRMTALKARTQMSIYNAAFGIVKLAMYFTKYVVDVYNADVRTRT